MKILITGAAGFIGFHLSILYLKKGHTVYGVDNLNKYYSPHLKTKRLNELKLYKKFNFFKLDLSAKSKLKLIPNDFDILIHLAAQPGVGLSFKNQSQYIKDNILVFSNVLEHIDKFKCKKIFFASSSSVYSQSKKNIFKENDIIDNFINFYGLSKYFNELQAKLFSKYNNIPIIGLRFFTVYGPYGRPDMSYYKFTESIIHNRKIYLFNNGNNFRDFTYIDDITRSIYLLSKTFIKNKYLILNIGSNKPVSVLKFLSIIEKIIGKKSTIISKNKQLGDMKFTNASQIKINSLIDFKASTKLEHGLKKFIDWYLVYSKN